MAISKFLNFAFRIPSFASILIWVMSFLVLKKFSVEVRRSKRLGACILAHVFDVFIPPQSLPEADMRGYDRLGGMAFMSWIWAQHIAVQIFLGIIVSILTWGGLLFLQGLLQLLQQKKPLRQSRNQWKAFGLAIAVFGWTFRRWAKYTLNQLFTYQISIPKELIQTGPYAYLVHPSYTGSLLHFLGIIVLATESLDITTACVTTAVITAMASTMLTVRITDEEAMLSSAFGETWDAHVAKRWHVVPFVW